MSGGGGVELGGLRKTYGVPILLIFPPGRPTCTYPVVDADCVILTFRDTMLPVHFYSLGSLQISRKCQKYTVHMYGACTSTCSLLDAHCCRCVFSSLGSASVCPATAVETVANVHPTSGDSPTIRSLAARVSAITML